MPAGFYVQIIFELLFQESMTVYLIYLKAASPLSNVSKGNC